jgi:flagellar basal-body rod modification protein FlgD
MQISDHPNATSPFQAQPLVSGASGNGAASNSSSSSNSPTSTATITANDFLQLLVTELQNQDPTANTDPNEYVDQLVQVNSLQQQIQMNQTLDGGPTLTGANSGVLQELVQMNQTLDGGAASASTSASVSGTAPSATAHSRTHAAAFTGNLSSPSGATGHAAAETVATALSPSPQPAARDVQADAFEQFAARLKTNAGEK